MKNKRGNVAMIVIIIVIVVITAGIVGWMFAKKMQVPVIQTQLQSVNQSITQTSSVIPSSMSYIEVRELGFKIPIDSSIINDVNYKIKDRTIAYFSTKTLNNISKYCEDGAGGAISKVLGTPLKPTIGDPEYYKARMSNIKQFDGFFLFFSGPQAPCTKDNNDLEIKLVQFISGAFKNVNLINQVLDQDIVYNNSVYDFSLNFPQSWKDFKVNNEKEGATGIRITFSHPVAKCSFPVLLSTIKEWDDCKLQKDPNAFYWCGKELGRNEKYVFHPANNTPDCENTNLIKEAGVIIETFKLANDKIASLQTYENVQYGFSFTYPVAWKMVKVSQASSIDYLPDSRNFVAIYPDIYPVQDFSARVDVYNVSLAIVKRDNPFLKNLTLSIQTVNGISWTKIGNTDYLVEKNGKTYDISGREDLISQIVSTFKFTN